MNIEFITAHSPVWANEFGTAIDCMATFSHVQGEMPFTASADDVETHGRELFDRLVRGDFGAIAPYVPAGTLSSVGSPDIDTADLGLHPGWPSIHEFLRQANLENQGSSIRGIGLIWGSMLEDMLGRLITQKLGKRERADRMIFGVKIERAFERGLIDETSRTHLRAIKAVRNRCAHDWDLTLSNRRLVKTLPKLAILQEAYFPNLTAGDDLQILMKLVYLPACAQLILKMAREISSP